MVEEREHHKHAVTMLNAVYKSGETLCVWKVKNLATDFHFAGGCIKQSSEYFTVQLSFWVLIISVLASSL